MLQKIPMAQIQTPQQIQEFSINKVYSKQTQNQRKTTYNLLIIKQLKKINKTIKHHEIYIDFLNNQPLF